MYKFRVIISILVSICGIIFSIFDIISRNTINLIAIVLCLAISVILQLTANEFMGEAKLTRNGLVTYLVIGVIGAIIFRPFFHGFFILNNLFDGVTMVIGLPALFANSIRK